MTSFSLSEDLPVWARILVVGMVLVSVGLLIVEGRGLGRRHVPIFVSGALAAVLLGAAVLRPAWVTITGQKQAARVILLVDGSHRLALPADDIARSRAEVARAVQAELARAWPDVRIEPFRFGDGRLLRAGEASAPLVASDLTRALGQALELPGEAPRAVVVLSDGRLSSPGPDAARAGAESDPGRSIPVHTVSLAEKIPRDRSIRAVRTTGAAVAHEPLGLHVEVGCAGGLECREATVVVREWIEGGQPQPLTSGVARGDAGLLAVDLELTLDRTGARLIEVALEQDTTRSTDAVPHNDRRLLVIDVRRGRTRILHVAGRPTYDVRALRSVLKSDASIDLVAFFILRTEEDDTQASQDELSLIPFPVEELFTKHLPSFDAIVLQDIDARTYGLVRHFAAIKDYVLSGGGLILVGGPAAFSAGGYAHSPVEDVLPVQLPTSGPLTSSAGVTPVYTATGRVAPMLRGLREIMGETLPVMPGYNVIGEPRPSSLVLWEHPDAPPGGATTSSRMPLLALADIGDGRSIALSVDGTYRLAFGRHGQDTGGGGHRALWQGLLGWLMRDPRFEAAQARLGGPCLVGQAAELVVSTLPGLEDDVRVEVSRLSPEQGGQPLRLEQSGRKAGALVFPLRELGEGGYAARITAGGAPQARLVFACEVGGEAHADSRPDPERLEGVSARSGGRSVRWDQIERLPRPESSFVAEHRAMKPLGPAWAWTLPASVLLAVHWILRRARGLS